MYLLLGSFIFVGILFISKAPVTGKQMHDGLPALASHVLGLQTSVAALG